MTKVRIFLSFEFDKDANFARTSTHKPRVGTPAMLSKLFFG